MDQLFEEIRFHHYDLLDAAGARDFAVVDGESLCFELFNKQQIDMNQHGGQFLHFIWVAEKYLKSLIDRQMNFEVVFFDFKGKQHPMFFDQQNTSLYAAYMLARQALISHL